MFTPTNQRGIELEIVRMMREDGYADVPKDGDDMVLALIKLMNYIKMLRVGRR